MRCRHESNQSGLPWRLSAGPPPSREPSTSPSESARVRPTRARIFALGATALALSRTFGLETFWNERVVGSIV